MQNFTQKINNVIEPLKAGEINISGYTGNLIDFTIDKQLTDDATWAIFAEQFRLHSDSDKCWRGEFWGKTMRGGSLTYRVTGSKKLYDSLTKSVCDLLSTADETGRISTYPQENELIGWDMWVRKYVMLGLIYYYEICTDEELKTKIVASVCREADYIIARVGDEENQKTIFETSQIYGGLNSCSILEPFVKLYGITKKPSYLNFSKMLIESGLCKDFNLIQTFLEGKTAPYLLKHTKAYEMMSCMEGVLEYYKYSRDPNLLCAVENFVDLVLKTDYTIIGSCGCTHELFDHSSEKQTEYSEEVMQETCVTVTLMKLCFKLLCLTGNVKYAQVVERSAINALYGAVNNENQKMIRADAMVYSSGFPEKVEHESYPFDSYSPLYMNRRGRKIGGFKKMQRGRSYGCCACIGSAGTAIAALCSVLRDENGLYFERYCNAEISTEIAKAPLSAIMSANEFTQDRATITLHCKKRVVLAFRIPPKAVSFFVTIDGKATTGKRKDGYFYIESRVYNGEKIEISFPTKIVCEKRNGKIAFLKGETVLARDCRLDDITQPVKLKDEKNIETEKFANALFDCNVAYKVKAKPKDILLCDYAQAGKNYDEENCNITVWQNT